MAGGGLRICVMGCGRIGATVCSDLAGSGYRVTAVDVHENALARLAGIKGISTTKADLSDPDVVRKLADNSDCCVNTLPGSMGFNALEAAIPAGRPIVDVSFMAQDPMKLEDSAQESGACVVVDSGVAPGLSHVLVASACSGMGEIDEVVITVGGLPSTPRPPWMYFTVFNPSDVLEEYTRPARLIKDGKLVEVRPLSEITTMEHPVLGTLEAFPSDGLRTLLASTKARNMKELTLRYPGHLALVSALDASGFFSKDPIETGQGSMQPFSLATRLLEQAWRPEPGERDLTVLDVDVTGTVRGDKTIRRYSLLDEAANDGAVTSMARTTGYTCTSFVQIVLRGLYFRKGIIPPEELGNDPKPVEYILSHLKERNVEIKFDEKVVAGRC